MFKINFNFNRDFEIKKLLFYTRNSFDKNCEKSK